MLEYISTLFQALETTAESVFGQFQSVFSRQPSSHSLDFEISTLYNPKDPQVDIVFVHGLGGDSSTSWSCIDESTRLPVSWPATELPLRLHPRARILAYDYDTDLTTAEYLVSRTLLHQTQRLIEALGRCRESSRHRPIVFVCHSLGGIVVKNALVHAKSSQTEDLEAVCNAVYGIVFLGTPHTTSPKALADSLSNILVLLGLDAEDSLRDELCSQSTTLACSLERFKPLATSLSIYAISEASPPSRQNSGLDKRPRNDRHVYLHLNRDHAGLAQFSSRNDHDLHRIIDCINQLCSDAVRSIAENTIQEDKVRVLQRMSAEDKVYDLSIGNTLTKHLNDYPPSLNDAEWENFRLLEGCFSNWFKDSPSSDAWPIAILQGPAGSGKTQTALTYVSHHHTQYSSILWVNAANRSSLEASFREIAFRMVSEYPKSAPSSQLLGLDGISLSDGEERSRGFDGSDLRLMEQAIMEWLARPRDGKWLLVLDGLSPQSGYPMSPTWTGWLDQHTPARHWWREFLTYLPYTTGNRGHIIISTTSKTTGLGPPIISFKSPEQSRLEAQVGLSVPSRLDTRSRFRQSWQTAEAPERRIIGVVLFLSDTTCPTTPIFLFKHDRVNNEDSWTSAPRAVKRERTCLRLEHDFLAEGPSLLYHKGFATDGELPDEPTNDGTGAKSKVLQAKSAQQGDEVVTEVLEQVWEALLTGLQTIQKRRDFVFAWDDEEQVVRNISTLLRRCQGLPDQHALQHSLRKVHDNLLGLAGACEAHGEYETAWKLYDLEMERHHLRGEVDDKLDFALQLDCARVYQRSGQYSDAEAQYNKLFSTYSDAFKAPDIKQPVDERITAYSQFARMRASQGRFDEAIEQMSKILALEDPFGNDTDKTQVTESIGEMALYLFKSGNEQAASASLHRILASLEKTRGSMYPATLSTMEVLSSIKAKIGQIDEAEHLLTTVYERQLQRLGKKHPKTVLCRSRMAAAIDLGGNPKKAEHIFIECLDAATECLGPRHPALFSIRDDFAHCLVTLGKQDKAREELNKLKDEFKVSPGLYSSEAMRRIRRLLECEEDIDFLEMDLAYPTRSTLGVGGFYSGDRIFSDGESSGGSDYDTDED